jgi:hypothetical protein
MEESGALLRLFPVPFRLLDESAQFKKWQCVGEPVPTADDWAARYLYLDKINLFGDFSALEQGRDR